MTGSRAPTPNKAATPSKGIGTPSKNKKVAQHLEEGLSSPLYLNPSSPILAPSVDLYQWDEARDRRSSNVSGTFAAWALGKTDQDGTNRDMFHPPHVGAIESHSFLTRKAGEEEGKEGTLSHMLPYLIVGTATLFFCMVLGMVRTNTAALSDSIIHNIPFAIGCWGFGDILAQLATRDATTTTRTSSSGSAGKGMSGAFANYSWERTIKAMILGILVNGVIYTFWLAHLDRIIPDEVCGVGSWTAICWLVAKAIVDDLLFGPVGNSAGMVGRRLMEGDSAAKAMQYWHERIVGVTIADLYFWPAWGFLNFWLVPGNYHVPFTAAGGIIWQLYMSIQSHFGGGGAGGGFPRDVVSKGSPRNEVGWCEVVHVPGGAARSLV